MNDKQSDKPKTKTFTEEEFNKKLTEELKDACAQVFTYSIEHKLDHYGRNIAPEFSIELMGGDLLKVHELAIKLEDMVIQFSRENPPVG